MIMGISAKYLLLHGAIVLLIGLLCGAPYGVAIKRQNEELIRAWKLAHSSLSLGGATMIAIAACFNALENQETLKWIISISYIISGYGFCFAMVSEPFLGARGLSWSGTRNNKIVYVGNSIGAAGSLAGTIALVIASYLSL
jgi:hypothetical protein